MILYFCRVSSREDGSLLLQCKWYCTSAEFHHRKMVLYCFCVNDIGLRCSFVTRRRYFSASVYRQLYVCGVSLHQHDTSLSLCKWYQTCVEFHYMNTVVLLLLSTIACTYTVLQKNVIMCWLYSLQCPEVTLCGWQDVQVQKLINCCCGRFMLLSSLTLTA